MDLYILDDMLRRTEVVDWYRSLVWKESFSAYGEFELIILSDPNAKRLFTPDRMLTIPVSTRIMLVETAEDGIDEDGRKVLNVKGRSLEKILLDRVAKKNNANLTENPFWSLVGRPGDIIRQIFETICVEGALHVGDKIPFIAGGNLYPADTIPEPDDIYTMEFKPDSVYKIAKEIADAYSLGFRLTRDGDSSKLYFNVYSGSDRTTAQTGTPAVVFARDLENLKNVKELTSLAAYKNTCYVFSKNGNATVYSDEVSDAVSGFQRRAITLTLDVVKVNDVELPAGPELTAELQRLGREELAKNRAITALDGEISQSSDYVYDVHYSLGDLVEMRSESGATNRMRIVEQIWVADASGVKSYPTLAVDLLITPGSWLAWDYNQTWSQATGDWASA